VEGRRTDCPHAVGPNRKNRRVFRVRVRTIFFVASFHRYRKEAHTMSQRTTEEVLRDHLQCRQNRDIEADLSRNYAEDVVLLTMEGVYRGHDGVRANGAELRDYLGSADFAFPVIRTADRFAFIEWRAHHDGKRVCNGAESYVIEDGKSVREMIRYVVRQAEESVAEKDEGWPEPSVKRHSDAEPPRYSVEFMDDKGETLVVECMDTEADGEEDRRQHVIAHARRLARQVGSGEDRQWEAMPPRREAMPPRT